jgi:hypothetical protein
MRVLDQAARSEDVRELLKHPGLVSHEHLVT